MTTYKDIRGTHIVTVTSDPPAPANGQVWYNSTDQVMKGLTANPAGSWASGGNLNTARRLLGGVGIQTAALAIAGDLIPPAASTNKTESYNGTSWTEVNDTNTPANAIFGFGTYTSAIAAGFNPGPGAYTGSESWNGTNWTAAPTYNNSRFDGGAAGVSNTSGLIFGGFDSTFKTNAETWDGSSWTEVGDLNTARYALMGAGTQTAAIAAGGEVTGNNRSAVTETWNGSAWTEVADLNSSRKNDSGNGTTTSALVYGGEGPAAARTAKTELWNGSAWTEVSDLSTGREQLAGAGADNTSGLAFGGTTGTNSTATEEFTSPVKTTVTFTTS